MDAEEHAKSFSNSRCRSNSHHVVLSAFGLLCSLLLLCVERNRSKLDIVVGYCCCCRRYCFSLPVYVLSFRRFFISPVHCLLRLLRYLLCLSSACRDIFWDYNRETHAACFVYLFFRNDQKIAQPTRRRDFGPFSDHNGIFRRTRVSLLLTF